MYTIQTHMLVHIYIQWIGMPTGSPYNVTLDCRDRSCRIPIYVLSHYLPREECMTSTSSWGILAGDLGASWSSLLNKAHSTTRSLLYHTLID